jgi:NodT family efflux transporter outer membrane factor (OMF) lipoprotein
MKRAWMAGALAIALLSGEVPASENQWSVSVSQSSVYLSQFPELRWWEGFQDPHLNRWVEAALTHNLDLKLAQARVAEARSLAKQALGRELPTITAGNGFTRQRNSENLLTLEASQLQGGGPRLFAPGQTLNIYSAPLAANYELDVFLKNRLTTRAETARARSSEWTAKSVLTSVVAETVTAYIQAVELSQLLQLQTQRIALAEESLNLTVALNQQGLNTQQAVNQQQAALAELRQHHSELVQQQQRVFHQLAVLTGQAPQMGLAQAFGQNLQRLTTLKAGVPSELLLRRPDLRAAEAALEAAALDVRVARRAFFPTLQLTGQVNLLSTSLNQWWDWDSILAFVGAQTAQTLFSGGQRRASLRRYKSRHEQALLQYRKAILVAFQETEDALSRHQQGVVRLNDLKTQQKSVQDDGALLKSRYDQGLIPYQDTLPTTLQDLAIQQQVNALEAQLLVDTVSLYRAVGGGV